MKLITSEIILFAKGIFMKPSMIIEVLKQISESDDGISFVKLLESAELFDKNKSSDWTKLRIIISALIEDGLIEERHEVGGEDKMVDYFIEQKGIEFLEKIRAEKLVEHPARLVGFVLRKRRFM